MLYCYYLKILEFLSLSLEYLIQFWEKTIPLALFKCFLRTWKLSSRNVANCTQTITRLVTKLPRPGSHLAVGDLRITLTRFNYLAMCFKNIKVHGGHQWSSPQGIYYARYFDISLVSFPWWIEENFSTYLVWEPGIHSDFNSWPLETEKVHKWYVTFARDLPGGCIRRHGGIQFFVNL